MIEAVLFDLDGTFADTAPDLAAALNRVRLERELPDLPLIQLRPHASMGVRGLLRVGLGLLPGHPDYAKTAASFLRHYESAICVETSLFDGIAELVDGLEAEGLSWGIVTNKPQRYTGPLLAALGWVRRPHCTVSGDSSLRPKPAPDPLLLAARLLRTHSARCLYVGDDRRDMEAARAAGMLGVAVSYGYLGESAPIESWGADYIAHSPGDLMRVVQRGNDRIELVA